MAPVPIAFPPTSRKRALVGVTGLLAVGALGLASLAYDAAAPTRHVGRSLDAAAHGFADA